MYEILGLHNYFLITFEKALADATSSDFNSPQIVKFCEVYRSRHRNCSYIGGLKRCFTDSVKAVQDAISHVSKLMFEEFLRVAKKRPLYEAYEEFKMKPRLIIRESCYIAV